MAHRAAHPNAFVEHMHAFGNASISRLLWFMALAIAWHADANEATLWQAVRMPGHVVLIRHAAAPGTGDPTHFRLDDCATQRNLSPDGRAQAARIGRRFRDNGISRAHVYTSQWCRCTETAQLLGLGEAEPNAHLNSFFSRSADGANQTTRLRQWLKRHVDHAPLILVTHQVNITALTDIYRASGEMVVARYEKNRTVRVLGTLQTD